MPYYRVDTFTRWCAVVLAYTCVPLVLVIAARAPPHLGFWWDVWMAIGIVATGGIALLPLLSARWWTVEYRNAPFLRFLQGFHRHIAYAVTGMVLAHGIGLIVVEPRLIDYLKLSAPWPMLAGLIATVLFIVLIMSSLYRTALGYRYSGWRRWHVGMSVVAMGLLLFHLLGAGYYFDTLPKMFALSLIVAMPSGLTYWYRRHPPAAARPAQKATSVTTGKPTVIPRRGIAVAFVMTLLWTVLATLYALPQPRPRPAPAPAPCAIAPCL